MPTPIETVEIITDKMQALERAHKRTGKLMAELHELLAQAVCDHGEAVGVSPASIAPKDDG